MNAPNEGQPPRGDTVYDVVIVGGGITGALLAKRLGKGGWRVLILESGAPIQPNNNEYMQRFYESAAKVPESPYTPELLIARTDSESKLIDPVTVPAGRPTVLSLGQKPNQSYLDQSGAGLPFGSTYERIAGGTARHWLGTSIRNVPNDFTMADSYAAKSSHWPEGLVNWPKECRYGQLKDKYIEAEREIGVSGSNARQQQLDASFGFTSTYDYLMPEIPMSLVDQAFNQSFEKAALFYKGKRLAVTPTPAARNSQPFGDRRVCAGNTNCIPICPIQAKYDPTITLREALNTGKVSIQCHAVAYDVQVGENRRVTGIKYKCYRNDGPAVVEGVAKGKWFVLAANAIETPRLLQLSNGGAGIGGDAVGRYLMDHPYYVAYGLTSTPVFPYRGPLATAGIEVLRDGPFRSDHASFRVDISNDGWALSGRGNPSRLALDFILGQNVSGLNEQPATLSGTALVARLNDLLTRQVRLGFLVEQTPDASNRVTLSDFKDGLGLRRPKIAYDFSRYTKDGLLESQNLARAIFMHIGAKQFYEKPEGLDKDDPCQVEVSPGNKIKYFGSGHIVGTCRMGENPTLSVVNANLQTHDHDNLYIAGSSVFPTIATANPTLTIAALTLRLADTLNSKLHGGG